MENFSFTRDLALVLLTALVSGFLAKKLKQPLLTGYIFGGILIGALASRFIIFDKNISTLAEIGAAILMFMLGLEFSASRLKKMGVNLLLVAIIQILGVLIFFTLLLSKMGFGFYPALFVASALSLSSTAVVVKILTDKASLDTLEGEITVSWLLIQDLAFIPMMIILPVLAGNSAINLISTISRFLFAVLQAGLFLVLIVILGKRLLPSLVAKILQLRSRELLLLFVISLCLLLAFGSAALGFSFALGAFLAGFLISEIGITRTIFAEVRPLRDILAVIFFVSLGLLTPPQFLLNNVWQILSLSGLLIFVKFILVLILILYLGYHSKTAFLTALSLSQVGEFAAILSQMGVRQKLISIETGWLLISVMLMTLVLTPWLIGLAPWLYRRLKDLSKRQEFLAKVFSKLDRQPEKEELALADHIVICGYGRVGKYIGRALAMAEIPFVVVDYNFEVVKELTDKGLTVIYGDPAELEVLDYGQVDKAKAVIVAIPDRQTQEMVITNCQTLQKDIKIICRTHHEEDQARLKALKVSTIIQPEFEAAMTIVEKLLSEFGVSEEEIKGKISRLKIEHGMG